MISDTASSTMGLDAVSPSLLPKGVVEVTPFLYLGPETAVKSLLLKHNLRHVVRCMEEPSTMYDDFILEEREKKGGLGGLGRTSNNARHRGGRDGDGVVEDEETYRTMDDVTAGMDEAEDEDGGGSAEEDDEQKKVDEPKVKELPDEPPTATAAAAPAAETCPDCGLPVDERGNTKKTPGGEEPAVKDQQQRPHQIDWLRVPCQVHYCPMEDTLTGDITKVVPKAVDWIDDMLRKLDADVLKAEGDEEEEEEEGENEDDHVAEEETGAKADAKHIDPETDGAPAAEEDVVGAQLPASAPVRLGPNDHLDLSRAVYVHCKAGVSRSATVIASYLMARKQIPLQRVFDEFLPPTARPNPSFIHQLMWLEESFTGKESNFDVAQFNLDGLEALFPEVSAEVIKSTLEKRKGNVVEARTDLMKRQLMAMNRDKLVVESLWAAVGHNKYTLHQVEEVYKKHNKQRDAALMALMHPSSEEAE